MRIPAKILQLVSVLIMVLFFLVLLATLQPKEKITPPPPHPGYEPIPEYWEGVPLEEMGLELVPYCDPVQITNGPANKRIPAIGVAGSSWTSGSLFTYVHLIWSEPTEGAREIWERYGPVDGSNFSEPRLVTEPDSHMSFNPVAISGGTHVYLGYMDESVNTREIWFTRGNAEGWTDPKLVTDRDIDSRSWGANPMSLFTLTPLIELPLMLWFDHRFTKHEILFKVREKPFAPFIYKDFDPFEPSNWGEPVRVTDDDWFQFDPHADWSSGLMSPGFEDNTVHLVYMDSRYGKQEDKHTQHEGNCEVFYRAIKPAGPIFDKQTMSSPVEKEWEIGEEIQLSFTPGLSDLPRVSGKRYPENPDLDSAWVVWHELDTDAPNGVIICCPVEDSTRGEIHRLNPPGTIGVNPEIISLPVDGYEDLRIVAYQGYGEGEPFPIGQADIYIRIIKCDAVSEPVKISDSDYTCCYPKLARPITPFLRWVPVAKSTFTEEHAFCITWAEYRAGHPDLSGESQIFYRSFIIRQVPNWPPESQTYRKQASEADQEIGEP